jgi:lipid II:glycine glycyltransferase (peptidoglycan interpeptide bridge formation enzyme)
MAHIVQSPEWGKFKTKMGTESIRVGNIQYTKHKIPLSSQNYAYSPKIDPTKIDWEELSKSLKKNDCVAINFDVPDVTVDSKDAEKTTKLLEEKCKKSPRDTFAKSNVLLDITPDEEELLANMHKKHRYNIRLAEKKGVVVRKAETKEDFSIFYALLHETAQRQKYYIHSKNYYQNVWEVLGKENMCHILIAEHEGTPLVSWMLFTYGNTLYYPYGGSSNEKKHLQGSNLMGWEAIRLGKEFNCTSFDMWGAADDPKNTKDPWYGFTNFKLKYGGRHVKYISSYDYVVNDAMYTMFNMANEMRWKILNILK